MDTPNTKAANSDPSLASTTTSEQDRSTADKRDQSAMATLGQRKVNLMWESTQARIAIGLVLVSLALITLVITIYVILLYVMREQTSGPMSSLDKLAILALMAFNLLSSLVSLVIGFYFGRTNHTKTGGVKEDLHRGE